MYTNEERTHRYLRERRKDVLLIRPTPTPPDFGNIYIFMLRARVSFEKTFICVNMIWIEKPLAAIFSPGK